MEIRKHLQQNPIQQAPPQGGGLINPPAQSRMQFAQDFAQGAAKTAGDILVKPPARFAVSGALAPIDLARGVMGKAPIAKQFPYIGETYQSEGVRNLGEVQDKALNTGQLGVGDYAKALKPFTEVPLAGAQFLGATHLAENLGQKISPRGGMSMKVFGATDAEMANPPAGSPAYIEEHAGGWQSGQKFLFDSALMHGDASTVKQMLPTIPPAYKQTFMQEIQNLLGVKEASAAELEYYVDSVQKRATASPSDPSDAYNKSIEESLARMKADPRMTPEMYSRIEAKLRALPAPASTPPPQPYSPPTPDTNSYISQVYGGDAVEQYKRQKESYIPTPEQKKAYVPTAKQKASYTDTRRFTPLTSKEATLYPKAEKKVVEPSGQAQYLDKKGNYVQPNEEEGMKLVMDQWRAYTKDIYSDIDPKHPSNHKLWPPSGWPPSAKTLPEYKKNLQKLYLQETYRSGWERGHPSEHKRFPPSGFPSKESLKGMTVKQAQERSDDYEKLKEEYHQYFPKYIEPVPPNNMNKMEKMQAIQNAIRGGNVYK